MTDNKTYWAIKQREWAARENPPRSASARRLIRGASVRKARAEDREVAPQPTKAELLEQAQEAGVEVPKSATKAEIAEAIEEATSE